MLRNDAVSAQKCYDDPGDPGEDRVQRRTGCGACGALRGDARHHLSLAGAWTSFEDRAHTAHQLATKLTSAQEAVAVELRRMLLLPLDDLLAVCREFLNPDVSRWGLDRCHRARTDGARWLDLRRHGVSNLNALRPKTPAEPQGVQEL